MSHNVTPKTAHGLVEYTDGETNYDPDRIGGESETLQETDELEKQPVPTESNCPYCGGNPTDESKRRHSLSNIGYLHDDIHLECEDCGETWPCGVPIGEYDGGADLLCASCNSHRMLVHRVYVRPDQNVLLHLKCPNCYHFDKVRRNTDDSSVALVGYPAITGSIEGAKEYGYDAEEPPGARTGADDRDSADVDLN